MFKIHTPNSYKPSRNRENCGPSCETFVNVIVIEANHRQIDLNGRANGISYGVNSGVDSVQVVMNVPKVFGCIRYD